MYLRYLPRVNQEACKHPKCLVLSFFISITSCFPPSRANSIAASCILPKRSSSPSPMSWRGSELHAQKVACTLMHQPCHRSSPVDIETRSKFPLGKKSRFGRQSPLRWFPSQVAKLRCLTASTQEMLHSLLLLGPPSTCPALCAHSSKALRIPRERGGRRKAETGRADLRFHSRTTAKTSPAGSPVPPFTGDARRSALIEGRYVHMMLSNAGLGAAPCLGFRI